MEFKRYNDVMAPISEYLMDALNAQATTQEKLQICEERKTISTILWKYVNEDERIAANAIFDDIFKHLRKDNV